VFKLKLKLNEIIIAVLNFAELDILWHYLAIVFDYSNRVLTQAWYIEYVLCSIGIVHIKRIGYGSIPLTAFLLFLIVEKGLCKRAELLQLIYI